MEIRVAKFREILEWLKPVVPRNPSLPVLKSVLLRDGQAVATDLATMVIIPMPEADVPCLLPYADVAKMLQYVQGGEYLNIEVDGNKARLTWSEGNSAFDSSDISTFPDVPKFIPEVEESLDSDTLIAAMLSVLPYTATEASRPVLSGVTLTLGEPVEVAAGDGFRMAYQVLPLAYPREMTAILPSSSVYALSRLWEKTPRYPPPSDALIPVVTAKKPVMIGFDGKRGLRFAFNKVATAIVKLVEGSPPAWLKLIPKEEPVLESQVIAPELELAVRRAMRVAASSEGMLRMEFKGSKVTVLARGENQEIKSQIKTFATKGAPSQFGINATFLLEYLSGKQGIVTIAQTGKMTPIMFQHQNNPRVLIMPMNID